MLRRSRCGLIFLLKTAHAVVDRGTLAEIFFVIALWPDVSGALLRPPSVESFPDAVAFSSAFG